MKIRLWFIKDTDRAVYYAKLPPSRRPGPSDCLWVPRSVIEHRTIFPSGEHEVTLADWFGTKEDL